MSETQIESIKNQLIGNANVLIEDLKHLVEKLEKGEAPKISGEVQGAGSKIDVLCARLATLMELQQNK